MSSELFNIVTWSLAFLSITGGFLNARENIRGFYFWIVANIGWVSINIYKGIYAQAFLFIIYITLCIYGIKKWRK